MKRSFISRPWLVEYTTEDGARLDRLAFQGYDLLTSPPDSFRPPTTDYGVYEKRPVYGYDDCFPSVRPSFYPNTNTSIPDHGELWQLTWDAEETPSQLTFQVKSQLIPVHFTREIIFHESSLIWRFRVKNLGKEKLWFLHVIHPMMRLEDICEIQFPTFQQIYDGIHDKNLSLAPSKKVTQYLLDQPHGTANMLYLQHINGNEIFWQYQTGLCIRMSFDNELFRSVGIWWNRAGYPDEDGLRRIECAFEPIPGSSDHLQTSAEDESCITTGPLSETAWEIHWELAEK